MVDRGLQARLDHICRRQRRASLIDASVSGAIAAILAYVTLRLVALYVALPAYVVWWVCALACLVTLARSWDRGQTRLGAAFLADSRLGLHERLTAAIEFGAMEKSSSVLVQRLHQDAARFVPAIDPKHLVPYRVPRKTLLILPLLLFALLLHIALPADLVERGHTLGPMADPELHQQTEELESLAELLMQRAIDQDRPDLAQLSEALHQLAERLQGGELSLEDLQNELARLEDQMNAALDGAAPSEGTAASQERSATGAPPLPTPSEGSGSQDPAEEGTAPGAVESRADGSQSSLEEGNPQEEPEIQPDSAEAERPEGGELTDGELSSNGAAFEEPSLGSGEPGQGTSQEDSASDPSPQPGEGDPGNAPTSPDPSEPSERLSVDGQREQLTGTLDPAHTTVQHLDTLADPQSTAAPHLSVPDMDAGPTGGDEASVVREDVPPQFRDLVRRYFEQLASEE